MGQVVFQRPALALEIGRFELQPEAIVAGDKLVPQAGRGEGAQTGSAAGQTATARPLRNCSGVSASAMIGKPSL